MAPLRRNRDFMLLQAAQLLSSGGSQMTAIAYPLLVLALTGSPAKAGGFTLRIEGSKDDLRSYLAGHAPRIDHSTVYPDEAGFAAHAASVARAASA
jgi:hypothetical protein